MAIGCIAAEATASVASYLSGGYPHHRFQGIAMELLRRPPDMVKCPFLRAVLSLKSMAFPFRSSTAHIQVNSARAFSDLLQFEDVRHGQVGSTITDFSIQSLHLDSPSTTSATDISSDLPDESGFSLPELPGKYASPKPSLMVLGLSVHNTPVEMREKLAVPEADWAQAVEELCAYPHIQEAGILSTCNRLEIYIVAFSFNRGMVEVLDWMSQKSGIARHVLKEHLFVLREEDASTHLLKVASGLDSLVLGEGQILSQVKQVMKIGQGAEGFGRQLAGLFKQAICAGKRVRSETSIGTGAVSISSAAVELVNRKLSLKDARVCIVGAGKMAKLVVKHLLSKDCTNIIVLNRSKERMHGLQTLFPEAPITFQPLQQLARCIVDADVIFTCTASDTPLVHRSTVQGLKGRRHFVDISVPRNVSPCVREVDSVVVYNVDDLVEVVAGNKEERARKALEAQSIIDEELKSFKAWQGSLETVPTIKKLRAYAEKIRVGELEKYVSKMGDGLSAKDKKLVEELSKALVNKLLHGPTVYLRNDESNGCSREEASKNVHVVERMFSLHSEAISIGQKSKARADKR